MGRPRQQHRPPAPQVANLGRLLALCGWTQQQLADSAHLTLPYINQLLTGRKVNPTLDALSKIARAFGVALAVLIDRRLDASDLRRELSQAALRLAVKDGLDEHPKLTRFIDTEEAPVSVEGWKQLARILRIADKPGRSRMKARAKQHPKRYSP